MDFSPRSSWEANLARVLQYKEIPFLYENEAICLSDPKLNNEKIGYLYIPDFFLGDGSVIEVKGFWDMASRAKCSFFDKQFPERAYYILDSDFYYSLSALYSKKIQNWEDSQRCIVHHKAQIVGINFCDRRETVAKLQPGQNVILKRDLSNAFDKNAILCFTEDGKEIGFLSADWATIFAPKIDLGMTFDATVIQIYPKKIDMEIVRSNPDEIILWDFLL